MPNLTSRAELWLPGRTALSGFLTRTFSSASNASKRRGVLTASTSWRTRSVAFLLLLHLSSTITTGSITAASKSTQHAGKREQHQDGRRKWKWRGWSIAAPFRPSPSSCPRSSSRSTRARAELKRWYIVPSATANTTTTNIRLSIRGFLSSPAFFTRRWKHHVCRE